MYRLPDGKIIKFPKQVTINGVIYPKTIFTQWSVEKLNDIGIYPIIEEKKYDRNKYIIKEKKEEIKDGCIYITYTTVENPEYESNEMNRLRITRDKMLEETDYMMTYDYFNFVISEKERDEIIAYRQSLRDLPQNIKDIDNVIWPEKPTKIKEKEKNTV